MVLLALAGVPPEEIAADYALSAERLPARYAVRGEEDQGPLLEQFLASKGTTAEEVLLQTVAELDAEATLLEAGLSGADLEAVRRRMLDPGW
jgi:hypothetical protein